MRRRRWPRVLAALLVLVLAALVGAYWYERPMLLTGTGYAAHNACAVSLLAGRDDPATDLPPNPLVPVLRSSVDDAGTATESGILGVLARQRAWYTESFGCTLAKDRPRLPSPVRVEARNDLATDTATVPDQAVTAAVARAFGDDLDAAKRTALGTRAVLVLRDGRIVGERYADGFDAQTPQLGWSMSKSVTNLLVGRLVQEGKVRLTDSGLRPEWTDDRASITVDQLLRMTSGLSWDETYDLGTPITQMLYGEPDMGAYVAGRPLAHAPGTYQQYSSGSTTLLCAVLDAKTGGDANTVRREVFAPLGLGTAVLEPDASGTPVCSSYLWASPRDWLRIGRFALDDGVVDGRRLLPEGWMAASTRVEQVATTEEVGYAAGWWANRLADGSLADPTLPPDAYWASGHDGQRLYVVPSRRLVVLRLGFSPGVEAKDLRTAELVAALSRG